MKKVVTKNFEETRGLGKKLAQNLQGGEIICLEGDLGSGKTTFSQGVLEGLGAQKPYVSPTFMIMKVYDLETTNRKLQNPSKPQIANSKIEKIYHIDTYRVEENDILDLGWEEILAEKNALVLVEWPERISSIIPERARWIKFRWISENEREMEMNF